MAAPRARRFCLLTTFYPPASFGGDAQRLRTAASPNVHLIGWQQAPALARLYRAAIAVLVPRRGSLLEVVERSAGGLAYDDTAGLDRALRGLAGDRAQRDRLGAEGRAAVLAEWSADAHLARYFALIERLEAGRGALGPGASERN